MDSLIAVMNELHDLETKTCGELKIEIFEKLPCIVVLGDQSSGKSSVLESIMRQSILPRGQNMVTKCPIILQLINVSDGNDEGGDNFYEAEEEGFEFNHLKGRRFTNPQQVEEEIQEWVRQHSDLENGIVKEKIVLKVYSRSVINLTLVDLPGLVKVAVPGQPDDIEYQIKDLVKEYIENENSIILAVCSSARTFKLPKQSLNKILEICILCPKFELEIVPELQEKSSSSDSSRIYNIKTKSHKILEALESRMSSF